MGETRYARSGDVDIAYQVTGDGPVDIVYVPGFVSHLELRWEWPAQRHFAERVGRFARLIAFDKRGTGLSDRISGVPTLEERMDDLRAVMDAVGVEHAIVFAVSEGGPLALLFAASHPERVDGLVLYNTTACFQPAADYEHAISATDATAFLEFVEATWGTGRPANFFAPGADAPDMIDFARRFERYAATPRTARDLMALNFRIDVREVLPSVTAPALVVHRRSDPAIAVENGRWLAAHLPRARYVELDGDFHLALRAGHDDDLILELEEFATGQRHEPDAERILATVLFTDIVDSTTTAAAIGDRDWRALLDAHDAAVRRLLERHRGREINTTGDGFLATFDGPARAVRCAATIVEEARRLGLEVRAGVHTGECEVRGDDLAGIAVHIGARVAAAAGPGEVLVSSTVRDLVAGSGLTFEPRGRHTLKGVPGEWDLLAVATTG